MGYLPMKSWVSFFQQLQCSYFYYLGSGSYALDLICPTKGNVLIPSTALATRFNNGLRTQGKACLFVGVDMQGLIMASFLELNF